MCCWINILTLVFQTIDQYQAETLDQYQGAKSNVKKHVLHVIKNMHVAYIKKLSFCHVVKIYVYCIHYGFVKLNLTTYIII